jgi:hypothetical protein
VTPTTRPTPAATTCASPSSLAVESSSLEQLFIRLESLLVEARLRVIMNVRRSC